MKKQPNEDSKVLCAISHGLYEPWLQILREGQQKTWLDQEFPDGFNLIHFHGTPGGDSIQKFDHFHEKLRWKNRWIASALKFIDGFFLFSLKSYIPKYEISRLLTDPRNSIHIKFPDTYLTYRWKFLGLLNYFINETDADFLLVTSTASYIQPKLVLDFVRALPNENIYAGAEPYPNANFVSGSNRIISRSAAQQVLEHRRNWKIGVIEDVALTNLIESLGIDLVLFPITNISSIEELDLLTNDSLFSSFHFRLKSFHGEKRMDTNIMKKLHARILASQKVESNDQ